MRVSEFSSSVNFSIYLIGNSFLSKDCQIVIEKYNIAEEDAKSLKTFFDKYWSKFEKATSTLVVFPKACLY
jgi:hypothetical protein